MSRRRLIFNVLLCPARVHENKNVLQIMRRQKPKKAQSPMTHSHFISSTSARRIQKLSFCNFKKRLSHSIDNSRSACYFRPINFNIIDFSASDGFQFGSFPDFFVALKFDCTRERGLRGFGARRMVWIFEPRSSN